MLKVRVSDVKILSELRKGKSPAVIAKEQGLSEAALSPRIRKMRELGLIQRSVTWPFTYVVLTPEDRIDLRMSIQNRGLKSKQPTKNDTRRGLEVHKQGEWFSIITGKVVGGRNWQLRSGGLVHYFKDRDFSIIAYSRKFVVWLDGWKGVSPNQQIVDGRARIRGIADAFAERHNLVIEWFGYAGRPEFATVGAGEGVTKELTDGMGLQGGKVVSLDGAVFKGGTSSHQGKVHLSFSKDWDMQGSKAYAQRIHQVGATSRIVECPERLDKHEVALEKASMSIKDLFNAISEIKGSSVHSDAVLPKVKDSDRRECA